MWYAWPGKQSRESFEVGKFIDYYQNLPHGRKFEILDKQESPDYSLKDISSGETFGVELTSVYRDDRSVPDIHKKKLNGITDIPDDPEEIKLYKKRLIEKVTEKIAKAKQFYNTDFTLILSVHTNEHIEIHFDEDDWLGLVKENETLFDNMNPFCEVVFWPVLNRSIFSVKP